MVPSHNRHWQIQFDKYKIAQVLWRSLLTTNKFDILEQGFPYFFAGKCRHHFSGRSKLVGHLLGVLIHSCLSRSLNCCTVKYCVITLWTLFWHPSPFIFCPLPSGTLADFLAEETYGPSLHHHQQHQQPARTDNDIGKCRRSIIKQKIPNMFY